MSENKEALENKKNTEGSANERLGEGLKKDLEILNLKKEIRITCWIYQLYPWKYYKEEKKGS